MRSVNLKEVVLKIQKKKTGDSDLISVNGFQPEELIIMRDNPDVFFFATKARVILVVDVMLSTRELFSQNKYSNLSISMDLYQYLRDKYSTKAFNKPDFAALFNSPGSLTYMDFVVAEEKYIRRLFDILDNESCFVSLPERDIEAELRSILSNRKQYEVLKCRSSGITLDAAGNIFGVTRERIRQIESAPKKNIVKWLNISSSNILEKYCVDSRIDVDKLKASLNEELSNILLYVIRTTKHNPENHWFYLAVVDSYFYSPDFSDIEEVITSIKNIDVNFDGSGSFEDIKEKFAYAMRNAGLKFFTADMVEPYLENKDFRITGQKTYNRRITLGDGIKLVVKNDFPNGIRLSNKEDVEKAYQILENRYDVHSCKGRALVTRMQSVLIMRGRTTYDIEERIVCPEDLKEKILNYIYTMEEDRIPYSALYKEFQTELKKRSNIDNHYYLHGVVRLWTENDEDIVCLQYYVCRTTNSDIPRSKEYFKKFSEYLIEKARPVDVNEILNDFPHFNKMYVKYAMIYYDNIVSWGPGAYADKNSVKVSDEDSPKFKEILDKLTDNPYKYVSSYTAIDNLKTSFPEFLSKYMITSIYTLSNIISATYPDYFVNNPHILHDSVKSFTVDDLVERVFSGEIIDKRECLRILKGLYGKTNTTFSESIRSRMEKYAKIAPGKYILKELVALDAAGIDSLKRFVSSKIIDDKYYLPYNTKNFNGLPTLCVDWSPYLLCELVKIYDIGYIVVKNAKIQQDNLILGIVTKKSGITTKEELFRYLYFNVYDGPRSDEALIRYARKTGLFGNSFVENSVRQMVK